MSDLVAKLLDRRAMIERELEALVARANMEIGNLRGRLAEIDQTLEMVGEEKLTAEAQREQSKTTKES